jgi:hypothetical protein
LVPTVCAPEKKKPSQLPFRKQPKRWAAVHLGPAIETARA